MSALVARELSGLDRPPKEGACETDRVATGGAENAIRRDVRRPRGRGRGTAFTFYIYLVLRASPILRLLSSMSVAGLYKKLWHMVKRRLDPFLTQRKGF